MKQCVDPVGYRCRTVCFADARHDPADPTTAPCDPCTGRGITQDADHHRTVCTVCDGTGRTRSPTGETGAAPDDPVRGATIGDVRTPGTEATWRP